MSQADVLHWSPKDYLSDYKTAGLDLYETGAYHLLLWRMWTASDEQCIFPLDYAALAGVWRVSIEEAERLIGVLTEGSKAVLRTKTTRNGCVVFSKRLREQKLAADKSREKKSAAGVRSGAVRREKAANTVRTDVHSVLNTDDAQNELTSPRIHVSR